MSGPSAAARGDRVSSSAPPVARRCTSARVRPPARPEVPDRVAPSRSHTSAGRDLRPRRWRLSDRAHGLVHRAGEPGTRATSPRVALHANASRTRWCTSTGRSSGNVLVNARATKLPFDRVVGDKGSPEHPGRSDQGRSSPGAAGRQGRRSTTRSTMLPVTMPPVTMPPVTMLPVTVLPVTMSPVTRAAGCQAAGCQTAGRQTQGRRSPGHAVHQGRRSPGAFAVAARRNAVRPCRSDEGKYRWRFSR